MSEKKIVMSEKKIVTNMWSWDDRLFELVEKECAGSEVRHLHIVTRDSEISTSTDLFMEEKCRNVYEITVNYNLPFEEMLKEAGYFALGIDGRITPENFPITGSGIAKVRLKQIEVMPMKVEKLLNEFKECGFRPTKIEELLSFAHHTTGYSEFLFPIFALNSIWFDKEKNQKCAPCLDGNSEKRALCLGWPHDFDFDKTNVEFDRRNDKFLVAYI